MNTFHTESLVPMLLCSALGPHLVYPGAAELSHLECTVQKCGSPLPPPCVSHMWCCRSCWDLSPEVLSVSFTISSAPPHVWVLQELLGSLALGSVSAEVAESQVDLLYALCVRHPKACEAAMGALLQGGQPAQVRGAQAPAVLPPGRHPPARAHQAEVPW